MSWRDYCCDSRDALQSAIDSVKKGVDDDALQQIREEACLQRHTACFPHCAQYTKSDCTQLCFESGVTCLAGASAETDCGDSCKTGFVQCYQACSSSPTISLSPVNNWTAITIVVLYLLRARI
jgi:hypothetical protein